MQPLKPSLMGAVEKAVEDQVGDSISADRCIHFGFRILGAEIRKHAIRSGEYLEAISLLMPREKGARVPV